MQINKLNGAVVVILMAAALTACGSGSTPVPTTDVGAIFTFAASTMNAQLNDQGTQTAQAASPTPLVTFTPLPTFPVIPLSTPFSVGTASGAALPTTSTGGSTGGSTAVGCNNANYLSETKPDDGTQMTAGDIFKKGWSLENTGTCSWNSGYSFAFITGDQMSGKDIVLSQSANFTDPGHSNTFMVNLQAPATAGEYKGYWQMKNAQGTAFGSRVWVDIVVK